MTNKKPLAGDRAMPLIRAAVSAVLLASLGWFVIRTIHWPLLGDASLMHYVTFLMDHGRVPYREISDIDFPGAYVPDWLVIHTLGSTALAWRIYDLVLLTLAGVAIFAITRSAAGPTFRPASLFAGLWASALFALIHGRDGLYQVGQRDLTVAVLLLGGVAAILAGLPKHILYTSFLFGLGVGSAAIVKPTAMPFVLVAAPSLWRLRRLRMPVTRHLLAIGSGCILPAGCALTWLLSIHAFDAFVHIERTNATYYAGFGRRPPLFLLGHGFSPLLPVAIVWALLLATVKLRPGVGVADGWQAAKRQTILFAALLGLLAYGLQGKGNPYHRYTFLAFLLPIMAIDLDEMLERQDVIRWISAAVFAVTALLVGANSAIVAGRYQWQKQEFRTALKSDLLGVEAKMSGLSLSGRVQCLDNIAGCIATLYDMQLVQSSGFLYDELLFSSSEAPAVEETRAGFYHAMQTHPPVVFVVSDPLFPAGPNDYQKLKQWPQFARWLNENYVLYLEHTPTRPVRQGGPEFLPPGYRIYLRGNSAAMQK